MIVEKPVMYGKEVKDLGPCWRLIYGGLETTWDVLAPPTPAPNEITRLGLQRPVFRPFCSVLCPKGLVFGLLPQKLEVLVCLQGQSCSG